MFMKTRAQITEELYKTMDIAKRSMHLHAQTVVAGHSISRSQLELLFTIHYTQPTSAKQLAQTLHLTPGAVSQVLEELTEQSLIERETDPNDRRRQVLRVSGKGTELLEICQERRRAVMGRVIEHLSDDELVTWLKIQQKLISEFQSIHSQHMSQQSAQQSERNDA